MDPFLTRFYSEVADNLGDPSTAKRYPLSDRYRDLERAQGADYNALLNGTGQDSELGKTEFTIAVENDQAFYALPPLFRQFLAFEFRDTEEPRYVLCSYPSIDTYAGRAGVRILRDSGTLEIVPKPYESMAGDWTLIYRRGPAKLHHATAASITATTLVCAAPAADCGELVKQANYYAGCPVRIISAAATHGSAPQVNVCTSSSVDSGTGVVTLNFADRDWNPVPTGAVVYEILPELHESLDGLYALDVAMSACAKRSNLRRRTGLGLERHDLWIAARAFYHNSVADRAPERSKPWRHWEDDPYD